MLAHWARSTNPQRPALAKVNARLDISVGRFGSLRKSYFCETVHIKTKAPIKMMKPPKALTLIIPDEPSDGWPKRPTATKAAPIIKNKPAIAWKMRFFIIWWIQKLGHSMPDQKSAQVSESSSAGHTPANTFSTPDATPCRYASA